MLGTGGNERGWHGGLSLGRCDTVVLRSPNSQRELSSTLELPRPTHRPLKMLPRQQRTERSKTRGTERGGIVLWPGFFTSLLHRSEILRISLSGRCAFSRKSISSQQRTRATRRDSWPTTASRHRAPAVTSITKRRRLTPWCSASNGEKRSPCFRMREHRLSPIRDIGWCARRLQPASASSLSQALLR